MGLDTSHGAYHGAYSSFNRFRQAIARALGGSYPPHDDASLEDEKWYWGNGHNAETHPGIHVLMNHSDCDGEIAPADCARIALELTAVLDRLDAMGGGAGHIASRGGYGEVALRFIIGCESAARAGEPLDFH